MGWLDMGGRTGFSLGTNFWGGSNGDGTYKFKQQTGILGFRSGDFRMKYENDGTPFQYVGLGDRQDRWRSAAFSLGIGEFSARVNIFTGKREYKKDKFEEVNEQRGFLGRLFNKVPNGADGGFSANLPYGGVNEVGAKHRLGVAYLSWKNYNVGINSYRYIGHAVQNIGAHYIASPQRGFTSPSNSVTPYFLYSNQNIFTLW